MCFDKWLYIVQFVGSNTLVRLWHILICTKFISYTWEERKAFEKILQEYYIHGKPALRKSVYLLTCVVIKQESKGVLQSTDKNTLIENDFE
jgi:hypothetical protein